MRRATLSILLVLVTGLSVAGCSAPLTVREDFTLTAPWQDYTRVEVRTSNGDVDVRVAAGPDIHVRGTKQINVWSLDQTAESLAQLEVASGPHPGRADTFLLELRYPEALRHRSPGASLHVEVPQACAARVVTGNGAVSVAGLAGEVVLDTGNGAVTARQINGRVEIDTSNGSVEVEDVQGGVTAETSNGALRVRRIAGACELDTSNGRVYAEEIGGDLEAETSNGAIVAELTGPAARRVDLRTSNGRIELTVPRGTGGVLDCATSNGRISPELDDATLKRVLIGRQSLRAEINDGGPAWRLRTSNGDIIIRAR